MGAGETFTNIVMRFRQLSLNPGEVGVAGATYSNSGTLMFLSGRNIGALSTGTNGAGAETVTKTLTADGTVG